MRYALIDAGSVVANVILWDGVTLIDTPYQAVEIPEGEPVSVGWSYTDGVFAAPPVPPAPPPTHDEVEALRRAAFIAESDPLFFKAQRGEATMAEWEASVAAIRERYPYPA